MKKNSSVQIAIATVLILLTAIITNLQPIQADNTQNIEILAPQVQPTTIKVGDTFSINATLVNNSPNIINVQNGCGGPFSVIFDNHATVDLKKICNWMAIQIILKPGENITGTSLFSNLAYKATESGTANATITFSYIIGNQTGSDLSFDQNATSISKSFLFTINDNSSKSEGGYKNNLSPLKQFESGVLAIDVQCNDGFQLVFKVSDGSPKCVKPSSVNKLVLWGWAKTISDNIQNTVQDESSTKTITLGDNNKSITMNKDDQFLLKLGSNFNWNIEIDNQTVASRVVNVMVVKDAQGIYEAHNPGLATLTGVGDPLCLTADPPCKIPSILFKLSIVVAK